MFYNDYRPSNFDDVIGQPAATVLRNFAHADQTTVHTILLTGIRGVGKTTLARIFARAINCEGDEKPCGRCASCKEQNHPDITEIDSASYGLSSVQSIVYAMRLSPEYKYRVFIFDEAHALTQKSMSALLKAVEEPRSTSIVFLLTTDADKIDGALRSRCMWLNLAPLSQTDLLRLLATTALEEGMNITKQALSTIATFSGGSARDALSTLETFSYFDKITQDDVEQIVGHRVDVEELVSLCLSCKTLEALNEARRMVLYHPPKTIIESCIASFVKHMREEIEKKKSVKMHLLWIDAMRSARLDASSYTIQELPLELAIAQASINLPDEVKIERLKTDWEAFCSTIYDKRLSRYASYLIPVRVKNGAVIVCKRSKEQLPIDSIIDDRLTVNARLFSFHPTVRIEVI